MKNVTMKKKIIFTSKLLLGLFFIFISILIVLALATKEKDIIIPSYIGIPFFIVTVLNAAVFFLLFILEMMESLKERNKHALITYVRDTAVLIGIYYAYDTYIQKSSMQATKYVVTALIMTAAIRALKYWKRA